MKNEFINSSIAYSDLNLLVHTVVEKFEWVAKPGSNACWIRKDHQGFGMFELSRNTPNVPDYCNDHRWILYQVTSRRLQVTCEKESCIWRVRCHFVEGIWGEDVDYGKAVAMAVVNLLRRTS